MDSNLTKILAFVAVMLLGFLASHAVFGMGAESAPARIVVTLRFMDISLL